MTATPTSIRLPRSILIANRGEIAIRIARTCRTLGIRSVAVFTAADQGSPHVAQCDDAVALSGPSIADGYLDGAQIIAVAKACGADAIHPGYGFLSENAAFAQACHHAGILFIGPQPAVIAGMGDKIAAKRIAAAAGVPVVPGVADAEEAGAPVQDRERDAALMAAASALPFPLLLKASAGGGGRGMRIVTEAAGLGAAITAARREALGSFGNDRLLIERYITSPRHIEVQIFGDRHGHVVHLLERDCSVQRRHQKIIEEAPAPGLSEAARTALHEASLRLARSIGYDNAGTVEFVVDRETQEFFFLEVNTRLQVEHPVTEAILGLDLVDWQIRVAIGEPLPRTQDQIAANGWAVEARITAEDAADAFRPQTGRIVHLVAPSGNGIRWDGGISQGSEVTPYYDSMLAKVIAHGPDRSTAIARLDTALGSLEVLGLETNIGALRSILHHDDFVAGHHTTKLIEAMTFARAAPQGAVTLEVAAAAIVALAPPAGMSNRSSSNPSSPWQSLGAWRAGGASVWAATSSIALLDEADMRHRFRVTPTGSGMTATCCVSIASISTADPAAVDFEYTWRGTRLRLRQRDNAEWMEFVSHVTPNDGGGTVIHLASTLGARSLRHIDGLAAWRDDTAAQEDEDSSVRAKGPGMVVSVAVISGDRVEAGAPLLAIESMKMVQTLTAPRAAIVATVACTAGQAVAKGDLLMELTFEDGKEAST